MNSCLGHQYEYMSKFMVNSDEAVARQFKTCTCHCTKCGIDHYCLKPNFFVKSDFEGTDNSAWCCMRKPLKSIQDKTSSDIL